MVYSHCTGLEPGRRREQRQGMGSMGSNILCRNVYTGLRPRHFPGSTVSYCASPVPSTTPGPVPYSVNKPLVAQQDFAVELDGRKDL